LRWFAFPTSALSAQSVAVPVPLLARHRHVISVDNVVSRDAVAMKALRLFLIGAISILFALTAGAGAATRVPTQSGSRLLRCQKGASFLRMNELVFEITQESDGGFVAEVLGESIVTQADTWEELRANVREAVKAFYFDRPAPQHLRLHLVRDEVIA
jgi:predicted RNase H-like HicB family nuclease